MSTLAATDSAVARRPAGQWLRSLLRSPLAVIGLLILIALVVVAIFAPAIAPFNPATQSAESLASPSNHHLLGTDALGRDTLSRLIFGARVSLQVSVSVVLIALLIALPFGLLAGYRGGRFDTVIMRIAEAGMSIPALILALAIVSFLGAGTTTSIWALTVVIIPGFIRVVRGQTRAVCEETFVEASQSIGTSDLRIVTHRVLPSVWSPVIVQATIYLGGTLLAEASLSYLGLGTKPPAPSWGGMLQDAQANALFTQPWQVVFPGLAIVVTILAINALGDGLRDATGAGRSKTKAKAGRLGITAVAVDRVGQQSVAGGPNVVVTERAPRVADDSSTPDGAKPLLAIKDLSVEFATESGPVRVLEGLNLSIKRGEVLGLVGESGSGKSVTAMAIMRLLPSPPARIVSGRIELDGTDLLSLSLKQMRALRGQRMSMIFQDPMTSLDPSFTVGHHLREAQRNHAGVGRTAARKRSIELLEMVGISTAARRLDSYPHEFSGGMRQRVMIAIALANKPDLLIADEPTTALDVTVQGQILDVLRDLQRELDMALLFVTHDLGVIADVCDRVAVMYAGQIVESADVEPIFAGPKHPYTEGLLAAMPRTSHGSDRLRDIPGTVPMASAYPGGCRFNPRCSFAEERCVHGVIPLTRLDTGAWVRCVRSDELSLKGTDAYQHALEVGVVDDPIVTRG